MNRKIQSFALALGLLCTLVLPVCAEELESTPQDIPEIETTVQESQPDQETRESQENQGTLESPPATTVPEPQATVGGEAPTEQAVATVSLQEALTLDVQRQYPEMDRTYQAGYCGIIANGRLRLVIPFLNMGAFPGTIDVTLSAGFLTADEKRGTLFCQSVILQDEQVVENVFLADFDIPIPDFVSPGSYPVMVKVESGDPSQFIQMQLPTNVVIPEPTAPLDESTAPTDSSVPTDSANPTAPTDSDTPTESTASTDPTEPTAPTDTTLPTEPTEPSTPTEPSVPQIPTVLEIDSAHTYSGMGTAYENGYLPRIADGVMKVVLPLRCSGALWGDKLEASVSLDTSAASPFVVENLRKNFYLQSVVPIDDGEAQDIYLISFDIPLTDTRKNGTYPVTINTSGFDMAGSPVNTSFTLYITITDGVVEKIAQPTVDTPTAEPVVYVSKTVIEPKTAQAGEAFTMTVTLKNSITTKSVRNMLVTVDTGNVQINLDEDSSIFPVEAIDRGGEATLILHFSTEPAIPSGKYPIRFSFKYDSSKTLNLSSTGAAIVEIQQPANMELVMPRFPNSVSVGETIPMSFQIMNMGRSAMHNVRCVVSGFGFVPSNTGYIGTMEAGTSRNTKVELYIIALNASIGNENGPQYGNTTGTVTLLYEDETGQEYSQEATFDTTVNRPVVQLPQNNTEEEKAQQRVSSWWISVSILGGVILAAVGTTLLFQKKKRRGGNYL